MAIVNAPDKVHFFQKWAKEVVGAATINFGSRVKSTGAKNRMRTSKMNRRRRTKRKRRSSRKRSVQNG